MQAVYHGFGVNIHPSKLSPPAFEPIVEAVMLVLGDTTYTVCFTQPVCSVSMLYLLCCRVLRQFLLCPSLRPLHVDDVLIVSVASMSLQWLISYRNFDALRMSHTCTQGLPGCKAEVQAHSCNRPAEPSGVRHASVFASAMDASYHKSGCFGIEVHLVHIHICRHDACNVCCMYEYKFDCVQKNAKRIQKRMRNKRRQPMELAADVVEHVLDTEGDPYMHTKQHVLSWWQLSLLDVKLFLATLIALPIGLFVVGIWHLLTHFTPGMKPFPNFLKSARKHVKVA